METILEQQRRYHEERERLMDVMVKEMLTKKSTVRPGPWGRGGRPPPGPALTPSPLPAAPRPDQLGPPDPGHAGRECDGAGAASGAGGGPGSRERTGPIPVTGSAALGPFLCSAEVHGSERQPAGLVRRQGRVSVPGVLVCLSVSCW